LSDDHPIGNRPDTGTLFVVAAPSGAGKTSLVNAVLALDANVVFSISHTTRPPRPAERDGRHYHFVHQAEFDRMISAGEFLEHAKVFDHSYGTSNAEVDSRLERGKDVMLDIDWQGARQARDAHPECCSIFVLPPSLQTLRQRLSGRAQDSPETIERRMRDARAEISHWNEFDFVVVNDNFETARDELLAIIQSRRDGVEKQPVQHPELLEELLKSA
jgi:guanylate kinase